MGLAARPIRRGWVGRLGEPQHRHYGCTISLLGCHGKFRQSGLEHEGQLQDPACSHPCGVVQSGTCSTMVTAALSTNTLSLLLPRSAGNSRNP
jgi:hypothetical protein